MCSLLCVLQNPGRLKLQSNSVIFKNIKTGKIDQFQSTDVEKAQWLKRAKGYCLKLVLNNDTIQRYDGFKDTVSVTTLMGSFSTFTHFKWLPCCTWHQSAPGAGRSSEVERSLMV